MLKTFWLNMRTSCLGRQVLEGGVVLGSEIILLYFHVFYIYIYMFIYILLYIILWGLLFLCMHPSL
jgi:hypothetical protein